MQEYNLSALATLSTDPPPPAPSPTPAPDFILKDLFTGDPTSTSLAIKNLEALAKLGNADPMNDQGKLFSFTPSAYHNYQFTPHWN